MTKWQHLTPKIAAKIPGNLADWLLKPYELTKHLRKAIPSLEFKVLSEEMTSLSAANMKLLNTQNKKAWQRKIMHCNDNKNFVFASLVVPDETYVAFEKEFGSLKENPIGDTLLFNNPNVTRSRFTYRYIAAGDPDYNDAFDLLGKEQDGFWARQSIFYWGELPLIITEIFAYGLPKFKPVVNNKTKQEALLNKLTDYAHLLRLHRPLPILLTFWPTFWALWIAASGFPSLKIIIIFALGVFFMRSAGGVLNDLADRKLDGFIERTRMRPLAIGRIKSSSAIILVLVLCLISFILVLQLNHLTIALSFVALALAIIYPFMKRITHFPQVLLGVAFNWGVIMAFAAVRDSVPLIAWYLLLITVIWTVAYDTIYALADRKDDIKIGIKSTAVLFGRYSLHWIAVLQVTTVVLLVLLGVWLRFNWFFYLGVLASAGLFVYQFKLMHGLKIKNCIKAFSHNHWVGMVLFVVIFAQYFK